jgi:DNA invertase Pin-like site-specific DNA recombinase
VEGGEQEMKRVFGLIRLSTEEQATEGKAGALRQRHDIEAAAKVHGLTVVKILEAIGLSGTRVLGSPVFDELVRALPAIDGVALSAIDRLVRPGMLGDLAVFDPFQRLGKRIWTPTQEVDISTDNGFLTSGILGVLGGIERKMILARTLAGKEALRKQGRHVNGNESLPRGVAYDKATASWSYEEPDRSRILLAFQLLFERRSFREIAEAVGGGWTPSGLNRALQNPIWKGERVYGVKTDFSDRRREEPLTVKLSIEPLISPERWRAAQELISERRNRWRARLRSKSPFLLVGLLQCGSCEKPFYSRTDWRSKRGHHYYCSSRFPKGSGCGAPTLLQGPAERAIENMVSDCFSSEEVLSAILTAACRTSSADPEQKDIDAEIGKLERKRQRLIDLLLEEVIDKPTFNQRLASTDQRLRELRMSHPKHVQIDLPRLGRALIREFGRFCRLPFETKREFLRRAFTEIRVVNTAIPGFTLSGGFLGDLVSAKALPCSSA